jgi:hypothetical protein
MLTLDDIEDRQTREKIKKIQNILPWASVMLCRNALQESKGAVNGACFILSETNIDLSNDEDGDPKREEGPHKISESSSMFSYELRQDNTSGLVEVLVQPSISISHKEAGIDSMIEVLLPGNTVLDDLRETRPGAFKVPADTKFLALDKHGRRSSITAYSDPDHDHQGDTYIEWKHGEAKDNGRDTQKVYKLSAKQPSRSNKRNILGNSISGSPVIGESTMRTTRSMIRGHFPVTQQAVGGFSWDGGGDNHPFYRNERSTKEKQRQAFTATSVIRAACAPAKSSSSSGEKCGYHEVSPYGDIVFVEPYFKVFTMSPGGFDKWQRSKPVNDGTLIGTNRGCFIPSPWVNAQDSDKRGFLQTINVQGQYKKWSLEELRLGDYVRGRSKAPHLFSLFRKLPVELRLMVWKFARTSRVVEFRYNTSLTRCWTPCAPPSLLHVCQESRAETLRSCQLSFGLSGWTPRIYFDSEIDTLYLNFERDSDGIWDSMSQIVEIIDYLDMHDANNLCKVQSLAIDEVLWGFWNEMLMEEEVEFLNYSEYDDDPPVLDCLPIFTKLRELKIVRTDVVGFWKQVDRSGDEWEEVDFVDEDVEFVPMSRSEFRLGGGNVVCGCVLKKLKDNDENWSVPVIGYLVKVSKRELL